MKNKYSLLLSNTIIFGLGNLLVKLISFFLMPLYTSVLTAEEYGIAELLNSSIEIILPIASLCIVEALYRFSIDEDQNHDILFANSLIITFAGDILVLIISFIIYKLFNYQYSFEFALLYICISFYKIVIQFARGLGHTKKYAFYGVLNTLLLFLSNYILLVIYKGGISAYLLSFSISYGITGIIAFIVSKEYKFLHFKKYNKKVMKEMLKYSLPGIPNMLSWWVNNVSDRYIILLFYGSGMAGLYTAASKLPSMINVFTSVFQQAWQYSTSKEIASKDNSIFFSNVFKIYSFGCTFLCLLLITFNKFICFIILKEEFYVAWKFVPILLLAATFGCFSTFFGTFYNALKNNKMLMISTIIGAGTNIILNMILIPLFGGLGAAVATAISYLVIVLIRIKNIQKYIKLNINKENLIIKILILIICSISASFTNSSVIYYICIVSLLILVIMDFNTLKLIINKTLNFIKSKLKNKKAII